MSNNRVQFSLMRLAECDYIELAERREQSRNDLIQTRGFLGQAKHRRLAVEAGRKK